MVHLSQSLYLSFVIFYFQCKMATGDAFKLRKRCLNIGMVLHLTVIRDNSQSNHLLSHRITRLLFQLFITYSITSQVYRTIVLQQYNFSKLSILLCTMHFRTMTSIKWHIANICTGIIEGLKLSEFKLGILNRTWILIYSVHKTGPSQFSRGIVKKNKKTEAWINMSFHLVLQKIRLVKKISSQQGIDSVMKANIFVVSRSRPSKQAGTELRRQQDNG